MSFIQATSTIPEPVKTLTYALVLYSHQLLGVPLQMVSVMLITYANKSFVYGYLLTVFVNSSSSAFVYFICKKFFMSYIEKKYSENIFALVIRTEAATHPIRVSFLFRFMNIPGLYKNLGLILAKTVPFTWYIVPTLLESFLSNAFVCVLATAMQHGLDAINPKSISQKNSKTKLVFYLTYLLLGLQLVCILVGVLITVFKFKKIRRIKRLKEAEKWRLDKKEEGYVHDIESGRHTYSADRSYACYKNEIQESPQSPEVNNMINTPSTVPELENVRIFDKLWEDSSKDFSHIVNHGVSPKVLESKQNSIHVANSFTRVVEEQTPSGLRKRFDISFK